jgi:hypothetical protein
MFSLFRKKKYKIKEKIAIVDGEARYIYYINNNKKMVFTSYGQAEQYIRTITGFYGIDENRKPNKVWEFDEKGHLINE